MSRKDEPSARNDEAGGSSARKDRQESGPRNPEAAARNGRLRSRAWFDNPANPEMTALYLERYLNFGMTADELQSGKPIVGIAQTGSDLSPCNRHHIVLAE
jgi:dihydroxy-acid dehydratase